MTLPSKSKLKSTQWYREWFIKKRGQDRQWTKTRWHYRPANGRRDVQMHYSGLKAKRKWIYNPYIGKFRDMKDTYKNRKRIKQRQESRQIVTYFDPGE